MKRLDQWLVDLNIAPSRTKAKELLQRGHVQIQRHGEWVPATSASQKHDQLSKQQIRLADSELLKYVARSGLKLEGALRASAVVVSGLTCLDVGQSTGGFTDCLLQQGASSVIGVDVGKDQLADSLKNDARVESFEGVNARELAGLSQLQNYMGKMDLLVMDVSFISVTKVLDGVLPFLKSGGECLVLIKPQFELGADALNKNGIVTDPEDLEVLKQKMLQHFTDIGLQQVQSFDSQLTGRDGNQEFFIHAKK